MIYVYALALEPRDVADLTGVRGEPLVLVTVDAAHAVCGELDAPPAVDRATLLAQDALVRALHDRSAALLPMRFGTTAADADRARARITASAGLRERLQAVRGCEQMTIRIASETVADSGDERVFQSGTEYLRERAKRLHGSPALTALAAAPGPLRRDTRIEPARHAGLVGSIYHLIERGRADEYRAAVHAAAAVRPALRVLVTGPSPAYAFA